MFCVLFIELVCMQSTYVCMYIQMSFHEVEYEDMRLKWEKMTLRRPQMRTRRDKRNSHTPQKQHNIANDGDHINRKHFRLFLDHWYIFRLVSSILYILSLKIIFIEIMYTHFKHDKWTIDENDSLFS